MMIHFPRDIIKVAVRNPRRTINYESPKSRIIYTSHLARAQIDMKFHPAEEAKQIGIRRLWQKRKKKKKKPQRYGWNTQGTQVITMRSIECNRRTRMQSRDKRFNIKNESYAFDEHRFKCNRTEYGYILALTYQEITSLDHCCNMVVRELTRNYTVDMYVKL